eukprot:37745_1
MSSADNCKRNNNTNQKRKLDALNDNNSIKKRKFSSSLQNIFDREKQLKKEIKILKQERDYFINIYKQMIDIIQPSKSQLTQTQSNIQTQHINDIQPHSFAQSATETQLNNNNNNELFIPELESFEDKNKIIPTQFSTDYYCKECNRYFKSGPALGGHNACVHSANTDIKISRKHPGEYHCHKCKRYFFPGEQCQHFNNGKYGCKYCSKRFDSFQALGGHTGIHTKSKSKSNDNYNYKPQSQYEKNWNNSHFISVNCKCCKKHFNDIEKYCMHLKNEFDNDVNKKWLYCNEGNCDLTKKYSKQWFMAHLVAHGYGKPYHCNLNDSNGNKRKKCNYSTARKSTLMTHLNITHKISCRPN